VKGKVLRKRKPVKQGPLEGKRIGLLAGPEFSDFQAYYLVEYLSEFGAEVVNLVIGWPSVAWKFTRPATSDVVTGTFGLRLDPIPTMVPGERYTSHTLRDPASLTTEMASEFDGLIVLGGHSADVLRADKAVTEFVCSAYDNGAVIGALECGQMVLMSAGLCNGKNLTGYKVIQPFLERLGNFQDVPVVRDGQLLTARDSDACAEFVREFSTIFNPSYKDELQNVLEGRRILIVAGQDFEDVELCVPAMELTWRGAAITLGTFSAPVVSRPPILGLDVVMGNFGMSVPFQELRAEQYPVVPLSELTPDEFDAIIIPGAFCPWHCIEDGSVVELVKQFYKAEKVVAAICHGPLVLAAADLVKDKKIAGTPPIGDDVTTMGGTYSYDWPAVIEGTIVTAREPDDVPEFLDAITEATLATQLT
tara:strand:- start:2844 stop:4103 length:1260 start_codon:yes stop_codon:yes gene_type:complete